MKRKHFEDSAEAVGEETEIEEIRQSPSFFDALLKAKASLRLPRSNPVTQSCSPKMKNIDLSLKILEQSSPSNIPTSIDQKAEPPYLLTAAKKAPEEESSPFDEEIFWNEIEVGPNRELRAKVSREDFERSVIFVHEHRGYPPNMTVLDFKMMLEKRLRSREKLFSAVYVARNLAEYFKKPFLSFRLPPRCRGPEMNDSCLMVDNAMYRGRLLVSFSFDKRHHAARKLAKMGFVSRTELVRGLLGILCVLDYFPDNRVLYFHCIRSIASFFGSFIVERPVLGHFRDHPEMSAILFIIEEPRR